MWHRMRLICALLALGLLAACGGGPSRPSVPPEQLAAAAYRADGPPALTLVTVISNRTGAGGHTALMVSGSQRVIFDPAGSYRPDYITADRDVLYGVTDAQFGYYQSAHARATHRVVTHTIPVSPDVAEQALALVLARGTVPGAFCANATSGILRQLPGFERVQVTFYPVKLMDQITALYPDAVETVLVEDDAGHVLDGVADLPALD